VRRGHSRGNPAPDATHGEGNCSRIYPELLSFFAFPLHQWRKLRTTNVIDGASRCDGGPGPIVCFVNVECGSHHLNLDV
jgi:hypothetical protein